MLLLYLFLQTGIHLLHSAPPRTLPPLCPIPRYAVRFHPWRHTLSPATSHSTSPIMAMASLGHHQTGTTSRRSSPVRTSSPAASRRHHNKKRSIVVEVYAGLLFSMSPWLELVGYRSPHQVDRGRVDEHGVSRVSSVSDFCFKCFI
jgi:hypothetical protein